MASPSFNFFLKNDENTSAKYLLYGVRVTNTAFIDSCMECGDKSHALHTRVNESLISHHLFSITKIHLVFGFHEREVEDIADRMSLAEEHDQSIESDP